MVEWLQFHPVTVRGTGSNPVETAKHFMTKELDWELEVRVATHIKCLLDP